MPLEHEDRARKFYPEATKFEAVYSGSALFCNKKFVGWSFECKKKDTTIPHYGWMTKNYEVSGDPRNNRLCAESALRDYVQLTRKPTTSHGKMVVRNTGAATATGGGTANTGITHND
jgi:hypothetical protein